jgi:hypothetical protein
MMKYLPNIKEHRLIAVQAELDEAKKRPGSSNKQWLVAKRKELLAHCRKQKPQTRALYRSPGHEYRNDYLKPMNSH